MNKQIQVGDKTISQDSLFLMAEVGNQCCVMKDGKAYYDVDTAKKLIDASKEAGADAIKFIFWFPDEIMADKTVQYSYKVNERVWEFKGVSHNLKADVSHYEVKTKTENMYEMLSRFQFDLNEWADVAEYCKMRKIIFCSTVISPAGVHFAEILGLELYKMSSWDYNFPDLYHWVAREGKPMILDTGPVRMHELAKTLSIIKEEENEDMILLHCFHTDNPLEKNMLAIPYMRDTFDCLVGYSPAGTDDTQDIMAVTLGACVLEKRLCLDRNSAVLHSVESLELEEFKHYIEKMRLVKQSLGQRQILPSRRDLQERQKWFRHVVSEITLVKGDTINRGHLEAKRGEYGISPEYIDLMLGKQIKRDIKPNETIEWEDF